jgi:hypothetical protein
MKDKITEKMGQKEKAGKVKKTKKIKKSKNTNVASQKRFVSAVKVFLTDAEKEVIREKVGNFNSLSNYIRHHLGLPINTVGRKKSYTESALDLEMNEPEETGKIGGTEKPGSKTKSKTEKKTASGRQPELWDETTR